MVAYLGVDGGGTGCRAAVADATGQILGRGEAGPANIASDPVGARANILLATRHALAEAVGAANADAAMSGLAAGMGLAGANVAGSVGRALAGLPFARLAVETDGIATVKGALREDDGIVAAVGTGSVFARQQAGVIRQIGGWGLILGDEGSGAWIGRAMLSACLKVADGFLPPTPFADAVLHEHGGPEGIVSFGLTANPANFASLGGRVMAAQDDHIAEGILARATADVAAHIALLQSGGDLPVTFVGGLGAFYADRLAGRWTAKPAQGTALDGALLLARGL